MLRCVWWYAVVRAVGGRLAAVGDRYADGA